MSTPSRATLALTLALAACSSTPKTTECASGETRCGDTCVVLLSDAKNCGMCGNACPSGQACIANACVAPCAGPGAMTCGGGCVDTRTDNANCGTCGHACPSGQVCSASACAATCASPLSLCGAGGTAYCANTDTDSANCGTCAHACSAGEACLGGHCVLGCIGDAGTVCGASCVDTRTDNANCGGCFQPCGAGLVCSNSSCAATCGLSFTTCTGDAGTYCADTLGDLSNCGGCGNVCATPAHGSPYCAGTCKFACSGGYGDCDGQAANGCESSLATSAHCGSCGNVCTPGSTCDAGNCQPVVLTPAAPAAGSFMWQGLQQRFNETSCVGKVTMAVAPDAVCFVDPTDQLKCAGRVYTTTFGTSFVDAGQSGVDQVLLSLTANSATGNAICVHRADGTAWCMGDYNGWGQFGGGATGPSATWVQWGGASTNNLARLATGTWDQMCALDDAGVVKCSGYNFGTSPAAQPDAGHTSVWVTTSGTASIDDPATFRASAGRTECTVSSAGLSCSGTNYGTAGQVVDGNSVTPLTANFAHCWLTVAGEVYCKDSSTQAVTQHFAGVHVVALGSTVYTSTLCAAGSDGSLWCVGDNSQGKLGTGNTTALTSDTRVAPPGSVRIGCP